MEREREFQDYVRNAFKTDRKPREPGSLDRVSGKDSVLSTNRCWIPPSKQRHDDALGPENRNDLFRKVLGLLNKLTPENFKKISDEILAIQLSSSALLQGVIILIFEKARSEPMYSSTYAQLCKRLSMEAPNFEQEDRPCTFRILLLNKCRRAFENRAHTLAEYERGGPSTTEEEENRYLAKKKMLGNIKFIGELAKLEMLSETILHQCIQELLVDKKRRGDSFQDMSEDLECLCQILRTCGRILDTDKGQKLMNQYFERMKVLTENMDLPSRIRFMLKDVIELRKNRWMPRKATSVEGPMPMNQIRPANENSRNSSYSMREKHSRKKFPECATDMDKLFDSRMRRRGLDDVIVSLNSSSTNLTSSYDQLSFNSNAPGVRDNSFRSYNNQRTAYTYPHSPFTKHNQNNQHSNNNKQYNNSSKVLPPRFKKNFAVVREQNIRDVELRPAPNSILFNQAYIKKSSSNLLTRPASDTMLITVNKSNPAPILKESLPINQITTEKHKQTKKAKGPNIELQKKFKVLVYLYLRECVNLTDALKLYKEYNIPEKHAKEALVDLLNVNNTISGCEKIITLVTALKKESLMSTNVCQEALKSVCNNLDASQTADNLKKIWRANLLGCAVQQQLMTLGEVASLFENGLHYPLFLLVLEHLRENINKKDLVSMFNSTKVNLLSQLPEEDRSEERLAEILEERQLTFLYPLLRIQAELAEQLQADPTPTQFYKWIKENLDPTSYTEPCFINALMTVLLKYIMAEADSASPDASELVKKKERELLEQYTVVLQYFLHERIELQLTAIYSLQAHVHALSFPKGLLLRWFMYLYELELVEEEAFLTWKEELTDAYPGKGQALFQVNKWLTWLQEAEYEDDDQNDDE